MYCKKCGYKIENNDTECPFCHSKLDEKYPKYENMFVNDNKDDQENKQNTENFRDELGYINIKYKGWVHALLACGGYLLMNILFSFVGSAFISSLVSQGMDFSCASGPEGIDACPLEVQVAYTKVSAISQVICELIVVVAFALIFMKYLKYFFKEFKDKKTYKWYGIGFGLMYGSNFVYSMILQIFNITSSSTNQDAVNEVILGNPLLGFLFVVVAAPLFEEIIFRLGVFRAFTKKGKKREITGLILTTVIFALIHLVATVEAVFNDPANPNWAVLVSDLTSLPTYLIGAFFLTFAYYKSKNLLTSILMHMTWNFMAFITIIGTSAWGEEISQTIIDLLTRLF